MDLILLCLAAAAGGAINSIAGGGTLLTFPSLYAVLGKGELTGVLANGTSTVALFPGSVAGAWGFRRELRGIARWWYWLFVPSIAGGWIGALLVSALDPKYFNYLVPWLVLTAALLFALQKRIARLTGIGQPHERPTLGKFALVMGLQFMVGIYGGYFGAGIGILMLSALAVLGMTDIHEMNALKNLLAVSINGIAALQFILAGKVVWHLAVPMLAASVIGGYAGAHGSRLMNKELVRVIVVVIGFTLAGYYFYRRFAA